MTDEFYDQWLAERREQLPPPNLTDQIMNRVVTESLSWSASNKAIGGCGRFIASNGRRPVAARFAEER
jgi:hypothetical protein